MLFIQNRKIVKIETVKPQSMARGKTKKVTEIVQVSRKKFNLPFGNF